MLYCSLNSQRRSSEVASQAGARTGWRRWPVTGESPRIPPQPLLLQRPTTPDDVWIESTQGGTDRCTSISSVMHGYYNPYHYHMSLLPPSHPSLPPFPSSLPPFLSSSLSPSLPFSHTKLSWKAKSRKRKVGEASGGWLHVGARAGWLASSSELASFIIHI